MITLYKRNAQGKPLVWSISKGVDITGPELYISYGLVGGTLHRETIKVTLKNASEFQSRVNAKRKEGYKELSELKDGLDYFDAKAMENGNPGSNAEKNLIYLYTL